MNMSLSELESLLLDIKEIINYVEATGLKDRRTTLYLSGDTENLTYYVPEFAIAHLIGVNTNYLMSAGQFKETSSFGLLKELVQNAYRINKLHNEGHLKYEKLFSKHIKEKINIFKENMKINIYETEFVCKYDKNKSFSNSDINENCDYIIVKKYENEQIGIILLSKNNNLCVPISNRIFKDMEDAKEYLSKLLIAQEITLLSGCNTYHIYDDYERRFILKPFHKKEKFEALEEYKKIFNCSIDMSSDYKYMSKKLFEKTEEKFDNFSIIDNIVKSIVNGTIINRDKYKDSTLLTIIDAWNNHIATGSKTSIDGGLSYTDAIKELKAVKTALTELEKEKAKLDSKICEITKENTRLTEENTQYKENEQAIMKILKPEK